MSSLRSTVTLYRRQRKATDLHCIVGLPPDQSASSAIGLDRRPHSSANESALCARSSTRASRRRTNVDLPKPNGSNSKELSLTPGEHMEDALKSILGGAHSIVDGPANPRNRRGEPTAKESAL
jgi:hypothetical protein